jgi:hypothetical protein
MIQTPDIADLRRALFVLRNEADSARMTRGHSFGVPAENGSVGDALQRVAVWLSEVIMEKNNENPR